MKEEARRTLLLCIDSCDGGIPRGRFCTAGREEYQSFYGLTQLFTLIEQKLNEINYPQAFSALRTFSPPVPSAKEETGNLSCTGALATFSLRILFRQNASWQGTLTWLEGKQEECFRSVLELIFLLDSVFRLKAS